MTLGTSYRSKRNEFARNKSVAYGCHIPPKSAIPVEYEVVPFVNWIPVEYE